jgi:hypothetical protein
MKRLINQNLPPKTFTLSSLAGMKGQSVHARRLALSHLSGYPAGSHVVGRLQRMIKLDSMKDLLESILHLRDLVRLASDILNTVPGARVDKQQFIRSEILAYVQLQAQLYGFLNLTPEDEDLIAYMIASTEAPDSSWYLNYDATDKNQFVKLHKLLNQLEYTSGPVILTPSEGLTPFTISGYDEKFPNIAVVYDPDKERIVNITETDKYKERTNEAMALRNAAGNKDEVEARVNDIHSNSVSVLSLSQLRVWDHVCALFTSVELWDYWITPRTKTDASSNEERARGLKNFAAYLHSLLMYPHFFAIESFLATYETIEETIVKFVPLPPHEVARYEASVRKFDVLNAKHDVAEVFSQLKGLKSPGMETTITAFPIEFVSLFGFQDAINGALVAASKLSLPVNITELKQLANQEFNTLTLSHPISRFDVIHDINQLIIIKGIVSNNLKEASNSISAGTPRFLPMDAVDALAGMGLVINYSLATEIDLCFDPTSSSPDEFAHGALRMRTTLPAHTYDSVRKGRKDLIYSVDSGSNYSMKLQEPVRIIKMPDIANKLRNLIGHNDWMSLMPSSLFYNQEYYTTAQLQASTVMVERLLETLIGTNFDIIKRTISNPYSREIYATYLSSFALMYVADSSNGKAGSTGNTGELVIGYGNPYGTTYAALEQKQGAFDVKQIVQVTENVYLRILNKVPTPTMNLVPRTHFMIAHPHYQYASNSNVIDVEKWVITPGLMNFALAPGLQTSKPSPILLDKRYAYLNDSLFIQTEPLWRPTINEKPLTTISQTTKTWNRQRYIENVEFKVLTTYGSQPDVAVSIKAEGDEPNILKMVQELEQGTKDVIINSAAAHPTGASAQVIAADDLKSNDLRTTSIKSEGPHDLATPKGGSDKKHFKKGKNKGKGPDAEKEGELK